MIGKMILELAIVLLLIVGGGIGLVGLINDIEAAKDTALSLFVLALLLKVFVLGDPREP